MSTQSPEINKLAEALAKAQAEITGALKESANPFFKSKYADLAAVWDACRTPLSKNGLSVIQTTGRDEFGIYIETTLAHASGQWIKGQLPVQPVKNDPQGYGSAITYMRRYGLAAITGVAQVDDDGHAANGKTLGAHPEQPGPNDGQTEIETYRIPGHMDRKLAGKAPSACDPVALREAMVVIDKKYEGKTLPPGAVAFLKHCEPVVAAWENNPAAHEGSGGNFND